MAFAGKATEALNAYKTHHEVFTELKVPFDKVRTEVDLKLNKCSDRITETEKLYRSAVKTTKILEEKQINASNEQKEWKDIKIKLAKTSLKGRVVLNVGGDRYTTSVDTLIREKNTFFTEFFSGKWEHQLDNIDKSIFIDRNGKIFTYILEYLRTDAVETDAINNESLRHRLMIEAKYFRLQNLINMLTEAEKTIAERKRIDNTFASGILLEIEHKKKLNEFYGNQNQNWELIYKASSDGFDATVFHTRCNNKGPTMTIIRSTNNFLFGGYTASPWTSDGTYKNDTTAFLFTLTNPYHISPTKYPISPASTANAVLHNSGYGPYFGSTAIALSNNSNTTNSSIGFPNVYTDPTGKGNTTFTGGNTFLASDIEVFKLA